MDNSDISSSQSNISDPANSTDNQPGNSVPSTATNPSPPTLPWLNWPLGAKVVVRRREADGLYDALGELLETHPHEVVIKTRRGIVTVKAEQMVTGKLIEPPGFTPTPKKTT